MKRFIAVVPSQSGLYRIQHSGKEKNGPTV